MASELSKKKILPGATHSFSPCGFSEGSFIKFAPCQVEGLLPGAMWKVSYLRVYPQELARAWDECRSLGDRFFDKKESRLTRWGDKQTVGFASVKNMRFNFKALECMASW
ncbi:unnamed protein product [Durusdinium trenchii]|uniref:Uncharacterized protein n=1 Tax=Durusdinium trenchii TaxID=1381693 RepID=A0ABP0P2P9_9DINO